MGQNAIIFKKVEIEHYGTEAKRQDHRCGVNLRNVGMGFTNSTHSHPTHLLKRKNFRSQPKHLLGRTRLETTVDGRTEIVARKELNPIEKKMAVAFMGQRLFIFTHIGALMMLITSFHPFFWPHQVPGGIIMILSIVYDLWRGANKNQRRVLLWSMFIANFWVLVNYFGHIFTPTVVNPEEAYRAGQTMTFGMLAHFIIVAGIGQGLMSLRLMDNQEATSQ